MASSHPNEKYSNVSLNIFVLSVIKHQYSQKLSSTWRKNILATIYIKDPYPFFGSDSGIRVAQKQGTFEDQCLTIIEVKKYLH